MFINTAAIDEKNYIYIVQDILYTVITHYNTVERIYDGLFIFFSILFLSVYFITPLIGSMIASFFGIVYYCCYHYYFVWL